MIPMLHFSAGLVSVRGTYKVHLVYPKISCFGGLLGSTDFHIITYYGFQQVDRVVFRFCPVILDTEFTKSYSKLQLSKKREEMDCCRANFIHSYVL